MNLKKIRTLLHHDDFFFSSTNYLIKLIMKEWQRLDLDVETIQGIDHKFDADLVIPHLDLTVTPYEYQNFLQQYSAVINRSVVDISKSSISANLLRQNDAYEGPVIVKTDRNYGGLPEKMISPEGLKRGSLGSKVLRRIKKTLGKQSLTSWHNIDFIEPTEYPVFSSVCEVPEAVFRNSNLIVEKFLPEREGEAYHIRYYYFFGNRSVNYLIKSRAAIIQAADVLEFKEIPVPEEIFKTRELLGFDYGKFDYVLHEGTVVLLDVNRTPAFNMLAKLGVAAYVARHLAEGIQ